MSDRQTLRENKPPHEKADSKNDEAPKSYYYDDSTGYETYDAERDAEEEEAGEGDPHPTNSLRSLTRFNGRPEKPRSSGGPRKEQSLPSWPGLDFSP